MIEERKRKTLEELAAKKKNFIMKWPESSLLNKKKLRLRRKKLTKRIISLREKGRGRE
ncbi:MAG: hypothetical protein ACLU99_10845 [Alphaproteobacteria bacterium]